MGYTKLQVAIQSNKLASQVWRNTETSIRKKIDLKIQANGSVKRDGNSDSYASEVSSVNAKQVYHVQQSPPSNASKVVYQVPLETPSI